jgi:hypothetical protein
MKKSSKFFFYILLVVFAVNIFINLTEEAELFNSSIAKEEKIVQNNKNWVLYYKGGDADPDFYLEENSIKRVDMGIVEINDLSVSAKGKSLRRIRINCITIELSLIHSADYTEDSDLPSQEALLKDNDLVWFSPRNEAEKKLVNTVCVK